jgi:hypothetical protein
VKITGRRGRRLLRLDVAEAVLLGQLLDELTETLAAVGDEGARDAARPAGAVLDRLYPDAYRDDEHAAEEFRSLTESTLHTERLDRIAASRADIADPVGGVDVDIADPDAARRWLQVLNDLRLTHGTRLGITEDDDTNIDPRDPGQGPRLVYYWLTAVQDAVVRAVMH